jgi:hypothetical protein
MGKLNELTIVWSIRDFEELKKLINFALKFVDDLPSLKKAKYKDLRIHEGAYNLDIIDFNVGSLNLLSIEDHIVDCKTVPDI